MDDAATAAAKASDEALLNLRSLFFKVISSLEDEKRSMCASRLYASAQDVQCDMKLLRDNNAAFTVTLIETDYNQLFRFLENAARRCAQTAGVAKQSADVKSKATSILWKMANSADDLRDLLTTMLR